MRLNTFKAIRFNQEYWNSHNAKALDNSDTANKIRKTGDVLNFLNQQISRGIATIDNFSGLYVLKITTDMKSVVSVIGEVDYDEKPIFFSNEETHKDKLDKYKQMFSKYKLQTNPILTFYKNGISIRSIVKNTINTFPIVSTSVNGMKYDLWYVNNPQEINNIRLGLQNVDKLYIADGHHRFSIYDGMFSKPSAKLVISVTDSDSILLKSCHRVILGDINPDWIKRASLFGKVEKVPSFESQINKITLVFRSGDRFSILLKDTTDNIYSIVNSSIINYALGIQNISAQVFPLPGSITFADTKKVFDLYKNGSVILFIPSIGISDFFDTVESGIKLPATSTWFEPKIVDGFIVRKY